MFKRILVPLDGSLLAERAIPHAELFARTFGSTIVLLQILDPTSLHINPNPVNPLNWQIQKTEADMYLHGIAARIRNELHEGLQSKEKDGKKSTVEYAIREGKPAENIVNYATTENIDLLILSTHGAGGLSRWNISSVTQKVIDLIYLPVLIIRSFVQPDPGNNKMHYRQILLPIDSSRRAECSLSAGIALARGEISADLPLEENNTTPIQTGKSEYSPKTKLYLAAVIKPPEIPIPEPYPIEIEQLSNQLMQISRQAVTKYLGEMKDRLPVESDICVVENNSVSSAIQELASKEETIDLVLLCAHGHTGESSWPYGSVARNYIEQGTKPVLIIQDIHHSQVRPTAAEIASGNTGGR
jgi:nucleotide-binding universal stress UspA family protein